MSENVASQNFAPGKAPQWTPPWYVTASGSLIIDKESIKIPLGKLEMHYGCPMHNLEHIHPLPGPPISSLRRTP